MAWNILDEVADDTAVETLLRTIPERWAEYNPDTQTAAETNALKSLIAVGLVELRVRFQIRFVGRQELFEGTVTGFGEVGFRDAMSLVLIELENKWADALKDWSCGENAGTPCYRTEIVKPEEWRLTTEGVAAKAGLDKGDPYREFVLDRAKGLDGFLWRHPRFGSGNLVRSGWIITNDNPLPVAVKNSDELADKFATSVGKVISDWMPSALSPNTPIVFDAVSTPVGTASTPPVDSRPPVNTAPKGTPGRKPDKKKQEHAKRANELRSETPQKEWKEAAVIVNQEFGLTGKQAYNKESLRLLHQDQIIKKTSNKKRD